MIETMLIVSICSGFFLSVSELLPYISKVKSNGIVQFILNEIILRAKNTTTQNDRLDEIVSLLEEIKNQQCSTSSKV
jgi:hypothetical protein